MSDLVNPKWMYAKAFGFLLIGSLSFGLLLLPVDTTRRIVLQLLMIWAFARAYYFVFYVIQHYVDDAYRFSGLLDFARYVARTRRESKDGAAR